MTNFTKSLPLFLTIFGFSACRNAQPPTAPAETATIKGKVLLAADEGSPQTPPFSGIRVSLDGTSFSTTTDDSGLYEFDALPEGTYDVRFSKAGYGDVRWFGMIVQGAGRPRSIGTIHDRGASRIPRYRYSEFLIS